MNEPELTSLSDYLRALRRRWWVVVLTVVIATGAALLYSRAQTPQYESDANVRLSAQPVTSLINGDTHQSATSTSVFVGNEAAFAESPVVVRKTIRQLGSAQTPAEFLRMGAVTGDATNAILDFTARAGTSSEAKRAATSWAQQYSKAADSRDKASIELALKPLLAQQNASEAKIRQAQARNEFAIANAEGQVLRSTKDQILTLRSLQNAISHNRQITPADSSTKVQPKTTRNVLSGAAIGLLIGLLLAGLMQSLDTRVRRTEQVTDVLGGVPLLSRIPTPTARMKEARLLAMAADNDPRYSEAYRRLRVNFDFANVRHQARSVMITSALAQEGKSTTVANLAIAMARAGRRVALVDFDLRRPVLHEFFHIPNAPGVVDLALEGGDLSRVIHSVAIPGASGRLDVMPAGSPPPNPSDFLESPILEAMLGDLGNRYDLVLVDSAPMLPVSDSVVLSAKVDAVLVIVPAEAKRGAIEEMRDAFGPGQAPVLGFILTASEHEADSYYSASYAGPYRDPRPAGPVDAAAESRQSPRPENIARSESA